MTREELLKLIKDLAKSQWLYGRLLQQIMELDDEAQNDFWDYLEEKNFKDGVEFILAFEGWEL